MNGANALDKDQSEFVEVDPTGRYGRYNEILGKGASKTVYKGFDEYEGIEVAWNQVKLYDFLQSPEDLERLYCEIHLLKTLKHSNIMELYTSWVDTTNMNINFVTEMFTSGTLRQFRQKHKRVSISAVKHWCRQILRGLVYLHSHDPPVIHRDLKCDNIFVNGNRGVVKIGDLGLATILRKSDVARCVGTPEFMAPEVYEEEYNELVDIYAFGMCVLEMVTLEYPYSECTHPAQIYKKVISGKKPDALYKVNNPEVQKFIEKCLATVSCRLPACELLMDPFLQIPDDGSTLRSLDYFGDFEGIDSRLRSPPSEFHHIGYSSYLGYKSNDQESDLYCDPPYVESNEINLFTSQDDENWGNTNITIKGLRREDDGIFLRIRMADKEGRVRNIYFPFDIEADTALSVASEMVAELDMNDEDMTKIANMIDCEIVSLVPEWNSGPRVKESTSHCQKCGSNGSFINYPSAKNTQVLQFHGQFEEVAHQCEGLDHCGTEGALVGSSQSDGIHYSGIWAQHGGTELSSQAPVVHHLDHEHEPFQEPRLGKDESIINTDTQSKSNVSESSSAACDLAEDYEKEIRQELRWLKAKYQMQLMELRDQQVGVVSKSSPLDSYNKEIKKDESNDELLLKSFESGKNHGSCFPVQPEEKWAKPEAIWANRRVRNYEAAYGSCSPVHMVPVSLHRATSLPVLFQLML